MLSDLNLQTLIKKNGWSGSQPLLFPVAMTISRRTSKQFSIINLVKMNNSHNYPNEKLYACLDGDMSNKLVYPIVR
jgi:hypothetical protein